MKSPETVSVSLGRTTATGGIAATMRLHPDIAKFVDACITRHKSGDWGDVDEDDQQANDKALTNGKRLLSVYHLPHPIAAATNFGEATVTQLWIITEWDRSVTTILWPSEVGGELGLRYSWVDDAFGG